MHDYDFFYQMKWPDGFRCPRCGHHRAYTIHTRSLPLYQCHLCRHQTTLIAGTVMERSRIPLDRWAAAIRLMSAPSGVNGVQLARLAGLTYKTALAIQRKIRIAISNLDARQKLTGLVHAGLDFYGRTNFHFYIRHPKEHPVIVGACENYVKIKTVPLCHMEQKRLYQSGIEHFAWTHSRYEVRFFNAFEFVRYPALRNRFRAAQAWINRTFHGIGMPYLQLYLDEHCFRVNTAERGIPDAWFSLCVDPNRDVFA